MMKSQKTLHEASYSIPLVVRAFSYHTHHILPGGCSKRSDHSLNDATQENKWILPDDDEIEERQDDEAMDKEAKEYCSHVQT